mgnify:CR=1 FL=1
MIELKNITKTFSEGNISVHAVKDVSLVIDKGEIFGIIGFSGAGKSTLVRCINLLERPDAGKVFVDGKDLTALKARDLRSARKKIGMIFQHFNLMPSRTVAGNVEYSLFGSGLSKEAKRKKVRELLSLVDIADKEKAYPSQLSGGQKQRVAIVRALAMHPEILLFDEVTAALDPEMVREVLDVMLDLAKQGSTMIIVTHEMQFAEAVADRVYFLDKGNIVETGRPKSFFSAPKTERARQFLNIFEFESIKDEKEEYNI